MGLICVKTGLPTLLAAHMQQGPCAGLRLGRWHPGWGSAFPGGFFRQVIQRKRSPGTSVNRHFER